MNTETTPETDADEDAERKLTIRLSATRYAAFSAIAQTHGKTPGSLLRELANRRIDGTQTASTPGNNERLQVLVNGRLDHLADCALHTQNQLARIENALAQIGNGPAETAEQLQIIELLVRKTLVQAVAASYTDIQVWRLIADPSQRPAQHVGDQFVEHASLAEQRMRACLRCVGLEHPIHSQALPGRPKHGEQRHGEGADQQQSVATLRLGDAKLGHPHAEAQILAPTQH